MITAGSTTMYHSFYTRNEGKATPTWKTRPRLFMFVQDNTTAVRARARSQGGMCMIIRRTDVAR